jgi:hypothetical protein
MRIFKNAWFVRFARAQMIWNAVLLEAVQKLESGQVDADLGGGVVKQQIARPSQGKSKGFRAIILYRKEDKAFFVYGFAKSDRSNIRDDEEKQFKRMAKHVLALSDSQLNALIRNDQLEEVDNDGKEVSE